MRRRNERLINQEDEKERKEAKENLGAGKGETVCFGSQDSHFWSCLLKRVNWEAERYRQNFLAPKAR